MMDDDMGADDKPLRPTRPLPLSRPAGPLVWCGGPVDRARVSLRLFAADLDPDEVTRLLGRAPTRAERRGDELPGRYHLLARTGSWRLKSDRGEGDELEEHIAALLDSLPDDPAV